MVTGRLHNIERNCLYCYCNINVIIISKNKTGRLGRMGVARIIYQLALTREHTNSKHVQRKASRTYLSA